MEKTGFRWAMKILSLMVQPTCFDPGDANRNEYIHITDILGESSPQLGWHHPEKVPQLYSQ